MKKNLLITTAIIAVLFVANIAIAEDITERQVIDSGEERTFNDATADGIDSPWMSGGVIKNAGTVGITNSNFTNNSANYGGAIFNTNILNIGNSSFENNHASASAGAIYNSSKGVVTITGNTTFSGNTHSPNAGGSIPNDIFNVGVLNLEPGKNETILLKDGIDGDGGNDHGTVNISGKGKVRVDNELIYHDVNLNSGTLELAPTTSVEASRFVIEEGAKFSADKTTFNDSSDDKGGAIYNSGEVTLSDSVFRENTAFNEESSAYGGAIYNRYKLDISNSIFTNNMAETDWLLAGGGAIYNDRLGTLTISDSAFTGNISTGNSNHGSWGNGGAIFNDKGTIIITNSTFVANEATGSSASSGGAIHAESYKNDGNITIFDSTFTKNKSSFGGAIYNYGKMDLTNVSFVENVAEFTERDYGGNGGAIFNYWTLTINGGDFTRNTAFDGGAIFNRNKATISSSFTGNSAYYGGAIYNEREITLSNSIFTQNNAMADPETILSGNGGAIYNGGKLSIEGSSFIGNNATKEGGAIYNESYTDIGEDSITITNSTFSGNKVTSTLGSLSSGGAISNEKGKITISNSTFTENETTGSSASSGGAIHVSGLMDKEKNPAAAVIISDSTFTKNKASVGGAIDNSGRLNLTNVSFVENVAEYKNPDFGGMGGALRNYWLTTITDGIFTRNSASVGGAIYNEGKMEFTGNTIFKGNKASGKLNDIYNGGKITVSGDLTLDGGITGYSASVPGKIIFTKGSNLTVNAGTTTITNNTVQNEGATLHLNVDNGFTGNYAFIADGSTLDNEFTIADNTLYNISTTDTKGTYTIDKKSASEIADELDISSNQARVISALTDGESTNKSFNAISNSINDLVQAGDHESIRAATKIAKTLAPEVSPMLQQTQVETTNQIFGAVGSRFTGGITNLATKGRSGGDELEGGAVWAQGLMNHAKLDKTSRSDGFHSDTYGVALGIERKINDDIKAGIGYAYNETDVDAQGRDTDVRTHTALIYAEYKPNNWFVNGILSYGWSDYKEKKNVAGTQIKADYDAETFGLQALTGYNFLTEYATLTPQIGMRYIHVEQDGYTDSIAQHISGNTSDIITGLIGSKVSKDIKLENGFTLTPEAKFMMTYDLKHDNVSANVALPNGSSYTVNGKALERFGVEVGAGLTAEFRNNIEVSLDYEGRFRKDYQDHSGLLRFKYKF